jgi:hypothetical protein
MENKLEPRKTILVIAMNVGTTNKKIHTMENNKVLKEQIIEVVKNQLRDNDPPETKLTYKRLIKSGYTDNEAKQLIGQCVAVELFNIFKHGKPFDEDRYIKNLNKLPKEPFD